MAAPFCSLIAARYAKYNHCTASLKLVAGRLKSNPYICPSSFNSFKARYCSDNSSLNLITSSDISVDIVLKSLSFSPIKKSTPYNATRR